MQLQNIQQQTTKRVEVYYKHLLKLANCLQVRATYVFFTTFFRVGLLPYLKINNYRYEKKYFNQAKKICYSM
jgi:hypothetical protein